MVTDFTLSRLESLVERTKAEAVLVSKKDVQSLLDEVRRRRLNDRMGHLKKLGNGGAQ